MRSNILTKDYPELTKDDLGDIYLIDGQEAVLASMSKNSQTYTYDKLQKLGVKIKLNTLVKDFVEDTVYLSEGTEIATRNLIWAAGISARRFEGFSPDSYGRGNRLKTNAYNLVDGYNNIYALGDCALVSGDDHYPNGHPQLAQAALQQARHLAENLSKQPNQWKPFKYKDLGSMAIIGRNKAVVDFPNHKYFLKGFIAWLIWIFVHIMSLVNFRNKLRTLYNWIGYYINKDQSFRMIIKPSHRKELL
jgi:NADH dehydrogenase